MMVASVMIGFFWGVIFLKIYTKIYALVSILDAS